LPLDEEGSTGAGSRTRGQGEVSEDDSDGIWESSCVAEVLWFIPILRYLLDLPRFFAFHRKNIGKVNPDDSYSLGYCFLLILLIERLIDRVLLAPEALGMRLNEVVHRAYEGGVPFTRMPLSSYQGRMIRSLAELYKPLRSVRSFSEYEAATEGIRKILLPSLERLSREFELTHDAALKLRNLSNATRVSGISLFFIYAHDMNFIRAAYGSAFQGSGEHRHRFGYLPTTIQSDQQFFEGFKLAVTYVWHYILGKETVRFPVLKEISKLRTWEDYDGFYNAVLAKVVEHYRRTSLDPLRSRIFVRTTRPSVRSIKQLIAMPLSIRKSQRTPEEKLERAMLWYGAIPVVDRDITVATPTFVVTLHGLVELTDGKNRVIRFVHPEVDGHGNSYSYAILIQSFGLLSDYSTWLLFVDFCNDFTGGGSSSHDEVEKHLRQLGHSLHVSELRIDPQTLRKYAERSETISLRKDIGRVQNELADAKGTLLELVVFQILSRGGFDPRWRYKDSSVTEGREIDLLGVNLSSVPGEIRVVECSTRCSEALLGELKRKVAIVRNHSQEIVRALWGVKCPRVRVSGWLVTSELEPPIRKKQGQICVLDGRALAEMAKSYNLRWQPVAKVLAYERKSALSYFKFDQAQR